MQAGAHCLTRMNIFRTIKPGIHPWWNPVNNQRPTHIHVSVFGSGFVQRPFTQRYFEGNPLIPILAELQVNLARYSATQLSGILLDDNLLRLQISLR